MVRSSLTRSVPLAAAVTAGCIFTMGIRPLPPADAGSVRESVRLGTMIGARHSVKVGSTPMHVETRTRRLSLGELPGIERGTATQRAAWSTAMWFARQLGVLTSPVAVFAGSRTVTSTGGAWRAACDFAWVDEMTTGRAEDTTTIVRLADALECRITAPPETTTASWRFRRGVAPTPVSIARVLDTLVTSRDPAVRLILPMTLEHLGADSGYTGGYAVMEDTSWTGWTSEPARWRVTREGTPIATLYVRDDSYHMLPRALDLTAAASDEDTAVLRLIAAAVMTPFAYP